MKNHWTSFVAHLVASRVLVDETKLPYEHYNLLKPGIKELESWAGMFSDLELDKPHTWAKTGMKVFEKVSHTMRDVRLSVDPFHRAMTMIGFEQFELNAFSKIFQAAIRNVQAREIYDRSSTHLYELRLSEEASIFMKTSYPFKGFDTTKAGYEVSPTWFLPSMTLRKDVFEKTILEVGNLFWANRGNLVLDKSSRYDAISFNTLDIKERSYEGDALSLLEEWSKFLDAGVRRCVLLQGDPGTGKSTLARHAAKKLSKKTLHLTQDFVVNVDRDSWLRLNSMLRPDIVVVDDVDRISFETLQQRLYLFEDVYHQVPLTILTANHYEELPDAFLRPGRIDQIFHLDDPDDQIKEEVIRNLAFSEGIESVPEEQMKRLLRVYNKYTGAYVVEYLRRVKVLGWDYKLPERDLTFEQLVGFEDELRDGGRGESSENVVSFQVQKERRSSGEASFLTINPVRIPDVEK